MSNALAIAAVTETLVNLITSHLDASGVTGAQVSALAPDGTAPLPNPGVNIFLYQVSPNSAYRNADLPTRDATGTLLLKKPLAALDLHYLFTFYGDDATHDQQRLLAATALALHAYPTLPRSLISSVQGSVSYLSTSTLDKQAELIRLTPIVFSLEELSKLWSFLLKIDYVLSTAYTASVVLIETDDPAPAPALPVTSYNVTTLPMNLPVITGIAGSGGTPIIDGATIVISGTNLAADAGAATQVQVSGATLTTLTPLSISPASLTVQLPPGDFDAGAHSAQIVQPVSLGNPPVLHPGTGVTSGIAAFVLLPSITGSVTAGAGPAVSLSVTPQVKPGQRVVLRLINKSTSLAQLFDGGTMTAATGNLTVQAPGLAAGTYFVQVLIDGALSPLTPPSGPPAGPLVTI